MTSNTEAQTTNDTEKEYQLEKKSQKTTNDVWKLKETEFQKMEMCHMFRTI